MTKTIGAIIALAFVTIPEAARGDDEPLTLGAYAEAFYQWNFAEPSNGLTNFHGFDNRHNSISLSNAAIDVFWQSSRADGRVTFQTGLAPSTYYAFEPVSPGSGAAGASDPGLWRWIQQAYVGFRPSSALAVHAGILLSPVGPESLAVKDSWAWSRSTLFFALPYYHAQVRAIVSTGSSWTFLIGVCNGWNNVVDNNDAKSIYGQGVFNPSSDLSVSLLYFGGIERPEGGPEGEPWRHLFDAHATWAVTSSLALQLHVDLGFEDGDLGLDSWFGAALSGRYQVLPSLFVAGRVDGLVENAARAGSFILIPVDWMASTTITLDYRPTDRASVRLEYRHDRADGDVFFGGDVTGDGVTTPFVPNRSTQDTLTIGLVTWI